MDYPVEIALYSDVHCPYGYITAFRLRKIKDEYRGRIRIQHKSLALEYVNKRSTPRVILSEETPILLLQEPEIPYQPWSRPDSEFPVTMWSAFEAVKCAQNQSDDFAHELDWLIRRAFFADSQCISMHHVLFELAEEAGLDMTQFENDFLSGAYRREAYEDARNGWDRLKVEGSPTFVLPTGEQRSYLALPKAKLDKNRNYRLTRLEPANCETGDCLDEYRKLFDEALGLAQAKH
jgi:predicted DsbA family dithiol-disulfide isomerase